MSGVRLEGDMRKLTYALRNLGELELAKANRLTGEILRSSTQQRFRNQTDPEGKTWAPSIRAQEEGGKTLSKNAYLRNSIRAKATAKGVSVGTNNIYAATHQFGDERTIKAKTSKGLVFKMGGKWVRKKVVNIRIPARPFLGINDDDMLEIKDVLGKVIREAVDD